MAAAFAGVLAAISTFTAVIGTITRGGPGHMHHQGGNTGDAAAGTTHAVTIGAAGQTIVAACGITVVKASRSRCFNRALA